MGLQRISRLWIERSVKRGHYGFGQFIEEINYVLSQRSTPYSKFVLNADDFTITLSPVLVPRFPQSNSSWDLWSGPSVPCFRQGFLKVRSYSDLLTLRGVPSTLYK